MKRISKRCIQPVIMVCMLLALALSLSLKAEGVHKKTLSATGWHRDKFKVELAQKQNAGSEEAGENNNSSGKTEEDARYQEDNEVVSIGQDRVIQEDELINGDVVVVGGNLTIYGQVRGDTVCVGGHLTVGPNAVVRGDLVNVGGKTQIDPSAHIRGRKVNVSGFSLDFLKHFRGFHGRWGHRLNLEESFMGRVLHLISSVAFVLFMLFMALLMTVFTPRQLANIEEHLTGDFHHSALLGVAAVILLPLVCLLFVVTCIGIPFLPLLLVAILIAWAMGFIAFSRALGRKLIGERPILLQVLIGLVLIKSVTLLGDLINLFGGAFLLTYHIVWHVIWVIGAIIFIGVSLAGLGGALYSRWGKRNLAQSQAKRKGNGSTGVVPPTAP